MFLIHLWPWNKVKIIKPATNLQNRSNVLVVESLTDLALKDVCKKKPVLTCDFLSQEIRHLSPLYTCESKNKQKQNKNSTGTRARARTHTHTPTTTTTTTTNNNNNNYNKNQYTFLS